MKTGITLNKIQMMRGEKDWPIERIIFITGILTLLTIIACSGVVVITTVF